MWEIAGYLLELEGRQLTHIISKQMEVVNKSSLKQIWV